MNRRAFVNWVGVGLLASSLPVAITACFSDQKDKDKVEGSPKLKPSNLVKSDGFQDIGAVADLKSSGQILNKEKVILVIYNPETPNTLTAVNPTCTHKGCTVAWKAEQKAFVCPCHKAKFSPNGNVISGPAKKPLSVYQAKIEGDRIVYRTHLGS